MAKQWTALPRSCCGYHREEVSLFPDAGNGGTQESAFCGELRHRRQTVRPSEPQSRLQPDLVDLVALLRKTVFLHATYLVLKIRLIIPSPVLSRGSCKPCKQADMKWDGCPPYSR